jgi:hypothetical protein
MIKINLTQLFQMGIHLLCVFNVFSTDAKMIKRENLGLKLVCWVKDKIIQINLASECEEINNSNVT